MLPEISQLEHGRPVTLTLKVATGILRATDQLYQTLSKFHHKQQSYGSKTNLLQGRPVTLTVATGIYSLQFYIVQTNTRLAEYIADLYIYILISCVCRTIL